MVGLFRRRKDQVDHGRLDHLEAMFKGFGATQGCLEIDIEGVIVSANALFLKWSGYTLDEIKGRDHGILQFPEQRTGEAKQQFWAQLRAGKQVSDRFRIAGKGGKEMIYFATFYPLPDMAGNIARVVAWGGDITDSIQAKRASDAKIAANEQAAARAFASLGAALEALAAGDLTRKIDEDLPEQFSALRRDLEAAMAQLAEALSLVATAGDSMQARSAEIARAADELSGRTERQAATLEETAAAVEEITVQVRRMAEGALAASATVGTAKQEAERSGEVVRGAVEAMGGIEASARQISQIIGVIDEIAFQTNLLALNAGVEAARAGDAGRGFAVVASEVRALAQRSAEAAKEIKTLIGASSEHVGQGVQLVGQTGEALQGIIAKVAEIAGLVSTISASAQEQASGLTQVNTAVTQMDHVTQQNAAMVEQSTAASRGLLADSEELMRLVSRFRTGRAAAAR